MSIYTENGFWNDSATGSDDTENIWNDSATGSDDTENI
jgi:hypothetical protein